MKYLAIILLILFTSCKSIRLHRNQNRFAKVAWQNPEIINNYCIANFKGKDSTWVETKYLPGKTDTFVSEPITVNCDSAIKNSVSYITVKCPPSTHTTDTLDNSQYHQFDSPGTLAELEKLKESEAALKIETVSIKTENSKLKLFKTKVLVGFGILALLFIISLIFKFILKWQFPKL